MTANTHPDHDTIVQRQNRPAFEAAFLDMLLLARQTGLLRVGTVSIDGSKIDANASKICSVRYDWAQELHSKLATDIAQLTPQAEAADAEHHDLQALTKKLARCEALKTQLDAACERTQAEARAEAEVARVCADGAQLILAASLAAASADAPSFVPDNPWRAGHGRQNGCCSTPASSGPAIAALQPEGLEPFVAAGRTQPHRPATSARTAAKEPAAQHRPWHTAMAKLETEDGKSSLQEAQADR